MARDGLPQKALIRVAALLDRRWHWYRLPRPLAVLTLIGNRMALRRQNLFDPTGDLAEWGPEPHVADRSLVRSFDGLGTDPRHPPMGSAGSVFGRNVRPESTYPQDVDHPNPRVVSNELLARGNHFLPATSLNLLFAVWIQFEIHDWMSHHTREIDDDPLLIEPPEDDREKWPDGVIKFRRTHQVHSQVDRPPTYRNTQSHWWDGSQLYGSHPAIERMLRTYERGHLKLSPEETFPFDPPNMKDIPPDVARDVDLPGVAGAWWVGLALFHTLFMREHNRICDHLAASIRLDRPAAVRHRAARSTWRSWRRSTPRMDSGTPCESRAGAGDASELVGLQGQSLWRWFDRLTSSEELSGIPGIRPLLPRRAVLDHRGVRRRLPNAPAAPRRARDPERRRQPPSRELQAPGDLGHPCTRGARRQDHQHERPLLFVRDQQPRCDRPPQLPGGAPEGRTTPDGPDIDLATVDIVRGPRARRASLQRVPTAVPPPTCGALRGLQRRSRNGPEAPVDLRHARRRRPDGRSVRRETTRRGSRSATRRSGCSSSWHPVG